MPDPHGHTTPRTTCSMRHLNPVVVYCLHLMHVQDWLWRPTWIPQPQLPAGVDNRGAQAGAVAAKAVAVEAVAAEAGGSTRCAQQQQQQQQPSAAVGELAGSHSSRVQAAAGNSGASSGMGVQGPEEEDGALLQQFLCGYINSVAELLSPTEAGPLLRDEGRMEAYRQALVDAVARKPGGRAVASCMPRSRPPPAKACVQKTLCLCVSIT